MAEGDTRPAKADAKFGQGFLTDIWYFVCLSKDLRPGRLERQELQGEPVLLGRANGGQLFALRDICPHRAAPLSAGRFHREVSGSETVECPYHGWRFRADGACAAIPSLVDDQAMDVGRIQVRRYPVAESQGLVFVWIGSDPPRRTDRAAAGLRRRGRRRSEAGRPHGLRRPHRPRGRGPDGPAHGPYVHQQWWWRSKHSQHEKAKRFEPREQGFAMVRHEPSKNSRAYVVLGGEPLTEITFRIPGLRWEHVTVGKRQVLSLTCLMPVNAKKTRITQIVWSDHPAFLFLKPFIAAGARTFLRQDGDMVNLQNQGLKYDPSLMWIDDADRQAKWYQQLKREWTASRREGRPFANPVEAATLRWRS